MIDDAWLYQEDKKDEGWWQFDFITHIEPETIAPTQLLYAILNVSHIEDYKVLKYQPLGPSTYSLKNQNNHIRLH